MEDNGLIWRKASKSGNGGECVEVGVSATNPVVGIRDTKSRERGMLTVDRAAFGALLASVRRGELD
jgi:hypothetical protein